MRPPQAGDREALVAHARPADVREVACSGLTFERALETSIRVSDWVGIGTVDGVPVCAFGVGTSSLLSGTGAPWLLGTTHLDRGGFALAREFLPASRKAVDAMRATCPTLVNLVHAENRRAIRWLRWLGFTVHATPTYLGPHPFHLFTLGV